MEFKAMNPMGMDVRTKYKLTKAKTISIKDCNGLTVRPTAYLEYFDTNNKGETQEVLAFMVKDEEQGYSTISKTFKRDFYEIEEIMASDGQKLGDYEIKIIEGESKAGRKFYTCELV